MGISRGHHGKGEWVTFRASETSVFFVWSDRIRNMNVVASTSCFADAFEGFKEV